LPWIAELSLRKCGCTDQWNSTTAVEWHSTVSNRVGMALKILKNKNLNGAMKELKLRAVD
jgi:hypothetical protein